MAEGEMFEQRIEDIEESIARRLDPEFRFDENGRWPEKIEFEEKSYDYLRENRGAGSAVYSRALEDDPDGSEILGVLKDGTVEIHSRRFSRR